MLQDEFGRVSVTLFPQVSHLVQKLLLEDELLYSERTLEQRFGRPQVKVKHTQTTKRIWGPTNKTRKTYAKQISTRKKPNFLR